MHTELQQQFMQDVQMHWKKQERETWFSDKTAAVKNAKENG